jgi:hypothetical protein
MEMIWASLVIFFSFAFGWTCAWRALRETAEAWRNVARERGEQVTHITERMDRLRANGYREVDPEEDRPNQVYALNDEYEMRVWQDRIREREGAPLDH